MKSYSILSTGKTPSILKLQTTEVANLTSLISEVLKPGYTTNNWILTDFVYSVSFSLFLFFLKKIPPSPSPSVFLQWPLLSSSLCSTVFILLQPPCFCVAVSLVDTMKTGRIHYLAPYSSHPLWFSLPTHHRHPQHPSPPFLHSSFQQWIHFFIMLLFYPLLWISLILSCSNFF